MGAFPLSLQRGGSSCRTSPWACLQTRTIVFLALLSIAYAATPAEQYTVGDSAGWIVPGMENLDYTAWAQGHTFHVGDTLLFKYDSEEHNVEEVREVDYTNCTSANAMNTYTDGDTVITLNKTGMYFFICGFPGHCTKGQKVSVTVVAREAPSNYNTPTNSSTSTSSPLSLLMGISFLVTILALY